MFQKSPTGRNERTKERTKERKNEGKKGKKKRKSRLVSVARPSLLSAIVVVVVVVVIRQEMTITLASISQPTDNRL